MSTVSIDAVQAGQVAARIRADLDTLVDRIAHRIMTEIPYYAEGGVGSLEEFQPVLRRNVEAALHGLLSGLTGAPHDDGPARDTGRIRARQNAPLAEVLTAYRIGFVEVCSAVAQAAQAMPGLAPDLVLELGLRVFETHNRDADAVMHGYREEAQHLIVQRERQRAALIDVLLAEDTDLATRLEVSRALRLPAHGSFVVVVATSSQGQDPMPRLASALAARDVSSVWRQRYDVSIGVLSLGEPSRLPVTLEILSRHAVGPVGASPVFTSLRRTPWALDLAQLVRHRLGDRPAVEQFRDTPLSMLVAGGRDVARETARNVLGEVLALPDDVRETLLLTLHTWVEAAGSANRAGELLHCHPNTIRKRLRRLEDYTGRSLSEPGGVVELVAACQAWSQVSSAEVVDQSEGTPAAGDRLSR